MSSIEGTFVCYPPRSGNLIFCLGNLNNYIRAVWLGSLSAQVEAQGPGQTIETSQVSEFAGGHQVGSVAVDRLLKAARTHSFLPLDSEGRELDPKWVDFVKKIQKERKAPKPSEAMLGSKPLFGEGEHEDDQLTQLMPMYPLGL